MPHHNNHNRGTVRSVFPTSGGQDSFESLAGLTQGKAPSVRSSPKGSVSPSPRRTERASPAPVASSVYSTGTNSAASASIFSKDPRKSSSASSNNPPNQATAYSLDSLSASNKSDTSLSLSAVDDFAQMPEDALSKMGLPPKHGNQIQNRKLQIAEHKARARAEAKAHRKKPVPRAPSHDSLHRVPSSHRGSTFSGNFNPYGGIPSGLSSRTQSALSSGSRSTSFDSYGNPRRLSSVSDGSSCDDGSVISGGSGLIEIDPWAEKITENYNSTKTYTNPALTQGITKTGYVKWRSGKSKNIKPQFVSCNGGIHARALPSDDGASSSSSEEMIVTPQVAVLRGRTRTTRALPERFHYKSGDVEHNRKANTQMKKEYGAKRGGEASLSYRHIRHTNDDDLADFETMFD